MQKTTITQEARQRVVQRLTAMVGISVAVQAVAFLCLSWAYRYATQFVLDAVARANGSQPSQAASGVAAAIVVALELFTALAVGFFAARRLLRGIVRATPHPMKPPTRPIPWAALSAAGVIVVFSILTFASNSEPLAVPWFGWFFELVRDGGIVALFWIAAVRAIGPKVKRS